MLNGNAPRRTGMPVAEYEAAVSAFIRARGVTRCPTACVVPTQATIGAADREALRQRWAEAEARRRLQADRGNVPGPANARQSAPRPPGEAGAKGRATLRAGADRFAASVLPIVEIIRAGGVTGLTAIAEELNRRGIGSPRGGKWRGSAVRRLLARVAAG